MLCVTSKNYFLPDDADAFSNGLWFNLWTKKQWPYKELERGDTLFWYESPSKHIVWKSQVVEVLRFSYESKKEVEEKLNLTPVQWRRSISSMARTRASVFRTRSRRSSD